MYIYMIILFYHFCYQNFLYSSSSSSSYYYYYYYCVFFPMAHLNIFI